jgi:hypothetical protein
MAKFSRRSLLARSSLPLLMADRAEKVQAAQRKLKVVVVGAHVDDPQSGCGGTIARYADLAHDVVALSLTRGDSESIAASLHMPPQELAAKRYADAQHSCALLHCRMVALHYINRGTEVTMARYREFGDALLELKPISSSRTGPSTRIPITGQLPCSPTTRGFVAGRSFRCTSTRLNWASRRRTLANPLCGHHRRKKKKKIRRLRQHTHG